MREDEGCAKMPTQEARAFPLSVKKIEDGGEGVFDEDAHIFWLRVSFAHFSQEV